MQLIDDRHFLFHLFDSVVLGLHLNLQFGVLFHAFLQALDRLLVIVPLLCHFLQLDTVLSLDV